MAYSAKVGSFNINTALTVSQTQAITGIGFQPKIILFWWSGSTATGDEVAGGNISYGFGAATSSTSRFYINESSTDAAATSAAYRSYGTGNVILTYSDGAGTTDGSADLTSLDADGFTIDITDQFGYARRISYLALGGDDLTNVKIGQQAMATSAGNYSVTGVGFQPDALICATYFFTSETAGGANYFSLGWATSSSAQGVISSQVDSGVGTSNTLGYGYNGETIGTRAGSHREAFVSFGADGFTMNHLEGASAYLYSYIALKGGQYLVGDLTTRTDGNDISETVGFQPVALLFGSANRALSTQDVQTDNARLSIGAATSASNRAVQAISDEDNLDTTETAYAHYDSAVYANVVDDAIAGLMDIKSIDATGFTAVMDDTDPSGCWVTYLAIGAVAGGGTTYEETGSGTSELSTLGADADTFIDSGLVSSAVSETGADATTFTDVGYTTSVLTIGGARAIVYGKTGGAVSGLSASGTQSRAATYIETGAAIATSSIFGADVDVYVEASAINSAAYAAGTEAATYTDSGYALAAAAIGGADAVTFTDAGYGLSGITATGTAISITGVATTQEGYRWRNDNGSESAATWAADQDAVLSAPLGKKRIRMLIDATGDPDTAQYQLEYRKVGDTEWLKVS